MSLLGGMVAQVQNQMQQHESSPEHDLVHIIGDVIGYWWVLALVVVGAYIMVPKLIRKFWSK